MTRRPWATGQSANCRHIPRCANIYELESGVDVTFPCSGLNVADAAMIVAAVNATTSEPNDIIAALEVEWRRLGELVRAAELVRDKGTTS